MVSFKFAILCSFQPRGEIIHTLSNDETEVQEGKELA